MRTRKVAVACVSTLLTVGSLLAVAYFYDDGQTLGAAAPGSDLSADLAGAWRNSGVSGAQAKEALDDESPAPPVSGAYDLSAHQTLSRVIVLIRENYVEPERIKPYEMFVAALDYIQKTVAEVMVDETEAPARITISAGKVSQAFDLGELDQLWEVTMALRDIFRFLQTRITDPTQRRDIEYAAINGMLSMLDPHSILLKPESFDEVKLQTKGEFGGLGIVISLRDGALTIISPIEGGPASKVGLKAKDKIVKIGEESTMNMALDEAVKLLRGRPGTKVVMWVQRKLWTEPKKFTLTRANIKIESVSSEMLPDAVGYIKLKSFQGNSFEDLQAHLEALRQKNGDKELKGLVLDLRNNPGGLLDQAILISDRFIDKGPLVITVGEGNRKREVKSAHFADTDRTYPIAVLLNGGSASASEIVSGALKNHDRAFVLGQQSFGKGSVQVLYDFKDRSALKLTIAQYLTPGDISIQSVGIEPDVQIVPAIIEPGAVHLFVDDDAPREKDLEKHLDQHGAMSQVESAQKIRITHLMPQEKDSDGPHDDDAVVLGAFAYDFETHLAHDILAHAKSIDRGAVLKEGMPLFAARAAEQEAIISKRLAELGVDWSPGPTGTQAAGAPRAEVSIVSSAGTQPVVAGNMLTVSGKVHNSGTAPLYRVYGVTASDNPLLKNQEFMFGKVLPGETRNWDIKIKLPADLYARADNVTLALGDHRGVTKDVSAVAFVHVDERKHPRFAYRYRIDDAKANGDGTLQVGEQVDLVVDVKNVGPGPAEDVTVTLKNLTGPAVYLDQGRHKLGGLNVGESKTAVLRFTMRSAAPTAQMRLLMWDNALGAPLSELLKLPVMEARKLKVEPHTLKVGKAGDETPLFIGADPNLPVAAFAKAGSSLRSDASLPGFFRVEGPDAHRAFVRQADVQALPLRKTKSPSLRGAPLSTTPDIHVELASLVVGQETLRLQGTLFDERKLKDVFVFVNDKKVYYRTLQDAVRSAGGVRALLDVPIKLKAGSNTLAVVAREDDDMMARKIFGVYRNVARITEKEVPGANVHEPAAPKQKPTVQAPAAAP